MILLLDNYDSFVHNLARYLRLLGQQTRVIRSDQVTVEQIQCLAPAAIVLSPGPKRPDDAGCSLDVVRRLGESIPILGVCLGHQTIGQAFGAAVVQCPAMHGQSSFINHRGESVFAGLPNRFPVGRYHSLALQPSTVPDCLRVTATTDEGLVMGVAHRRYPIHGVQFHPESVLTQYGLEMLRNFFSLATATPRIEALA
ncbi:anthranilate synthase component II [Roseimaritima sediminicola]|uniref:anthranilate synthase component II n=1 Tax=Roseimaritima sediminicola TaxID=2662066 RepID=UPI0012984564|nr:aminodeoxychorismate/anthranilate synthase component II [Roseimaritima sediminicola]